VKDGPASSSHVVELLLVHPEPHAKLHACRVGWYPAGHEKPHAVQLVPQSGSQVTWFDEVHPPPHAKAQA
jgi:hypothetical protein